MRSAALLRDGRKSCVKKSQRSTGSQEKDSLLAFARLYIDLMYGIPCEKDRFLMSYKTQPESD